MAVQPSLTKHLAPLAYGLIGLVAMILGLVWLLLYLEISLAGFLNGESTWSKMQKQAIVSLQRYALEERPEDLGHFRESYAILINDRQARDLLAKPDYDKHVVYEHFIRGQVIPNAIPGMMIILHRFSWAPYVKDALATWRSVDNQVAELAAIADTLEQHRQQMHSDMPDNLPVSHRLGMPDNLQEWRRLGELNQYISPRASLFSNQIAGGFIWFTQIVFSLIILTAFLASVCWLYMGRRLLNTARSSEQHYRQLFDSSPVGIMMVNTLSGTIVEVNQTISQWCNKTHDELINRHVSEIYSGMSNSNSHGELIYGDGQRRPIELHSSLTEWHGIPLRQVIISDLSDRMALITERKIEHEALSSIPEGVVIADRDSTIISANPAHARMTGFDAQRLVGRSFDMFHTLPDGTPALASLHDVIDVAGNWRGEATCLRNDGSQFPVYLSISATRDEQGQLQHFVAVCTDISASKAEQQRLERLATHDPLTGLYNRAEFERRCDLAITEAKNQQHALAVLFVDLDGFKSINDSYSHGVGDRLLVALSERIRWELGGHDVAGRIGGDEFTVLLTSLSSREQATYFAQRLLTAIAEPILIDECELSVTASIGIAGYPADGSSATEIIGNADAAMYAAKKEHHSTLRFHNSQIQARQRKRSSLAHELRRAVNHDELFMVYQPCIDLISMRVTSLEALLRWNHPEQGIVAPGSFIPEAETLGLIQYIDEWAFDNVGAQLRNWSDRGFPGLCTSVNVSAQWFGTQSLIAHIRKMLHKWQLDPQQLLLEITEGAILHHGEDMEAILHVLHELGVGISIDDFGTGYSSMSYLKLPAVTCLKIDRSFISGLPNSIHDRVIVEAMIGLARNLGLYCIAEGIDSEAQHDFLLHSGCSHGQGFLYAQPLSTQDVEKLLWQQREELAQQHDELIKGRRPL